jgi:hypothetical protein
MPKTQDPRTPILEEWIAQTANSGERAARAVHAKTIHLKGSSVGSAFLRGNVLGRMGGTAFRAASKPGESCPVCEESRKQGIHPGSVAEVLASRGSSARSLREQRRINRAARIQGTQEPAGAEVTDWYASVGRGSTSGPYLGNRHQGGEVTPYTRGTWHSAVDSSPADEKLGKLLDWLTERAEASGVPKLSGRWGEQGPEVVEKWGSPPALSA